MDSAQDRYELLVLRYLVRAKAHDLGNVITLAGGDLSLADTDLVDDVERRERIRSASTRMSGLTRIMRELTEATRFESGSPFPLSRLRDDLEGIVKVARDHESFLHVADDALWDTFADSGLHDVRLVLTAAILDEARPGGSVELHVEDGPAIGVTAHGEATHETPMALAAAAGLTATASAGVFRLVLPTFS